MKQLLLVAALSCVCDTLLVQPRVTRCSPATMAQGFGAPPAKPKSLTEKKQWKLYQELVLKGEPTVQVMVRMPDTAQWYGVGKVTAGGEGTIAQAVEHQKRLIMEHARRVHPKLKDFKETFDIGLQADPELEPFLHTNEQVEVPPSLVAGFEGVPDPATGMYMKKKTKRLGRSGSGGGGPPR